MTTEADSVTHTFVIKGRNFNEWLNRTIVESDKNKSEFIRTCILLAADTIAKTPSLCNRIQFDDRKQ